MLVLLTLSLTAAAIDTGAPPPVVNGERAEEGRWDDAAGVYFGSWVECTGVLVAPTIVLTAGHCMGGATAVRLGTTNYNQGGEKIRVADEITYPKYYNSYDIGILVLEEAAETEPRTIAQGCVLDNYLQDGADVAIVGYGATDYYGYDYGSLLMDGRTTVDDHDCDDMPGCMPAISPGGEIGAGADDDVDSCYGDSGGPLYLLTERGDYLVGITSRGYSNVSVPCRDGGIYVRPDAVIDWIEEETGVEIQGASCNEPPAPEAIEEECDVGETIEITLLPNDPDADQSHEWAIVEEPDEGEVEIDGDELIYTAPSKNRDAGKQTILLMVTDDGDPALSGTLEVEIDVEERGGCACNAAAAATSLPVLMGVLGVLGLRRRQENR